VAAKKNKRRQSTSRKATRFVAAAPSAEPNQESASPDGPASGGFPIVGIGASAGGLDAFKKFFSAMPADSGAAFILIPHLDPTHESLMVELLARQTKMPVAEAADKLKVESNHVYIIPPNKYMTIDGGVLILTGPVQRRTMTTPIDLFLRSLADDQQERAICIILSGTGAHGSLGLKAIKAAGGMAMVQDPNSAEYDHMPQNAVATGLADFILPPEKLPEALVKYVRHSYINGGVSMAATGEVPDQLVKIISFLRARTKHDFNSYRKKMLVRRIERRMGLNQIHDLAAYLRFLRENPEEIEHLSRDLFIRVTSFFRDAAALHALETQVLPELVRCKEPEQAIRVWAPGCATGEEPYSLAMLFFEQLAKAQKNCNLQIFATDVDAHALEVGRQGIYPESIAADVSPKQLARFFTRADEHSYQVNKQLRESVVFAAQNVISDPPFSRLDLVSCRNMLIYLEPEIQKKIILLFHFALNEHGYLFLGPSETIGRHVDLFEPVDKKWRIYRRIGPARLERLDFPLAAPSARSGKTASPPGAADKRRALSFAEITHNFLLLHYAPAAVLISRRGEILYYFGATNRYLEHPSGEPTRDLHVLAREELRSKLRTAIHKVSRENQSVAETGIRLKRNGAWASVNLTVQPVQSAQAPDGLLLVTFQDERAEAAPAPIGAASETDDSLVRQLEYELKASREDLQSTIEELESSNEELKAANEEVMSMNEELQSGNEELETSKEELQSLNEELSTVNNQLQDKVHELESATNDLANLFNSTDIATIFLDPQFQVKFFTPASTRLFNLISADVGRPISDIAQSFADSGLLDDAARVLKHLAPLEKEVFTSDGRCCIRRIVPYRTVGNRIEGVVITFVDITERKRNEEELRQLSQSLERQVAERTETLREKEELVRAILDTAAEGIITIDERGIIQSFNKAAAQMFGYKNNEIVGRHVDTLMLDDSQDDFAAHYIHAGVHRVFDVRREVSGRRKDGTIFPMELAVSELHGKTGRLFTAIIRDISERRALENQAITAASDEQRRIGQDLHDSVGQELTGLALLSQSLSEALTSGRPADAELAGKIGDGLKRLLGHVRTLVRGMVPTFGPEGLMTALEGLAGRISDHTHVHCDYHCDKPVLLEDSSAALHLYRIAQEAVNNAITHGKAEHITIHLSEDEGSLQMEIRDDGQGMPTVPPPNTGMGLKIMRHRTDLIGGTLDLESSKTNGTTVTCILPRGETKS
jgi:two-component system, chemotaxis family, CheB/CheR fusion protein